MNRNTVTHLFKEIADKTGIDISAQTLRSVFTREMSLKGVQDRYVDAFYGRTPQSVLETFNIYVLVIMHLPIEFIGTSTPYHDLYQERMSLISLVCAVFMSAASCFSSSRSAF
ncbi:hypothetical protein ANME2D_02229 [Candidatus Methanoperedens nitroreducens]|uniref:Uncharacterized protein n=1 Tax=Candidatus Methanoperedens nitratireducens TaxID=1392998 RepID=A0A062V4I1_9EURY|nr:hypothetical protein ANME2D_02229 [Candidatus Methanoperedens nitroreducens]